MSTQSRYESPGFFPFIRLVMWVMKASAPMDRMLKAMKGPFLPPEVDNFTALRYSMREGLTRRSRASPSSRASAPSLPVPIGSLSTTKLDLSAGGASRRAVRASRLVPSPPAVAMR